MKLLNKIFFVVFTLLLLSCEDLIEKDISNQMVSTIYPKNNSLIESNVVTMQWNTVDGAQKYRVQISQENSLIILDSVVNKTYLSHPISGGVYQWRVRAENSAYSSPYSFPEPFTILESDNLTNQQVILSSPNNELYTNSSTLICLWQTLPAAEEYTFQLYNVTSGQILIIEQSNLITTSLLLNSTNLLQEAEYQWKVKARNMTTETLQTSSRNFYVDRTVPNTPQLVLPLNNAEFDLNQNIIFQWSIASDTGTIQSPITYILEFSDTESFQNISQSSTINTSSFQESFNSQSTHYWRVKATDKAGNISSYSTPLKVVIK